MDAPLCKCGCGEIVEKRPYETASQWRKRSALGIFRDKCKRNLPSPSPKDRPTLVADITVWNLERPEGKEQPKEKRIEDAKYLEWIRSLPCLIPGCPYEAEAHHQSERGKNGTGTRTHDYRATPLCCHHHTLGGTSRLSYSYHGLGKVTGWKFWQFYGIDPETVIHDLNRAYLEMGRKFKEG